MKLIVFTPSGALCLIRVPDAVFKYIDDIKGLHIEWKGYEIKNQQRANNISKLIQLLLDMVAANPSDVFAYVESSLKRNVPALDLLIETYFALEHLEGLVHVFTQLYDGSLVATSIAVATIIRMRCLNNCLVSMALLRDRCLQTLVNSISNNASLDYDSWNPNWLDILQLYFKCLDSDARRCWPTHFAGYISSFRGNLVTMLSEGEVVLVPFDTALLRGVTFDEKCTIVMTKKSYSREARVIHDICSNMVDMAIDVDSKCYLRTFLLHLTLSSRVGAQPPMDLFDLVPDKPDTLQGWETLLADMGLTEPRGVAGYLHELTLDRSFQPGFRP